MKFVKFPKVPRLNRDCVITEKIDGTNAQVFIEHKAILDLGSPYKDCVLFEVSEFCVFAGSRNRYLTIEKDNYGFARWVQNNGKELLKLGPGCHFGEWWGQGIQRNYGLKEKRFSLFNVHKWADAIMRPSCCYCVPILYRGAFDTDLINHELKWLMANGSMASPGFMKPEGIIVFHTAANSLFKATCENDEKHKGEI